MLTLVLGRIVNRQGSDVRNQAAGGDADDRLVDAARLGDPDAFAVIYQRYKLDVWHLAWFTLRDHHDAEDVVQETFLKAHRALGQYRRDGTLRPWLLTICRNACRDRLRATQRRDVVALDEELAALAAPSAGAGDRDRHIDFHRALASLPDDEREAFLLVDVLGCHSDEAARILGLRASSTLRSRVAKARRALAPTLSEPVPEPVSDVWGLFHSTEGSAIVACPCGPQPDRRGVAELRARLQATGLPALPPGGRDGLDLLAFFERLEARIPPGKPVVAVLEQESPRAALAIARWAAEHPRWQVRNSGSHASWLSEVERLVGQSRTPLARLSSEDPFLWTMTG
jgi:RNA polymerase sigma-70 factor (ECF subfamily)